MFFKYLGYTLITIAALLLTFFGIGPVVFADGSMQERMITLFIVILIYIVLGFLWYLVRKKYRSK